MSWKQVRNFNINKMGTRPGYCLANVRQGFDIAPKYADAKADMEANRKAGTLHDISSLPTNVAVPVYLDVTSVYEHIIVSDHGTFYSDGKRLASLAGQKPFGWGETCNGVRVVEWVNDTVTKSDRELAEEVLEGKYGNGEERRKALGDRYAAVQAIVNDLVKGGNVDTPIKVGDRVLPINYVDYRGVVMKKTRDFYYVSQIAGDRAVLVADSQNGPVYGAFKYNNLRKV